MCQIQESISLAKTASMSYFIDILLTTVLREYGPGATFMQQEGKLSGIRKGKEEVNYDFGTSIVVMFVVQKPR